MLIVNADDFGLSPGVNEGIIAAHENGIVTSTSLMVRGRAADAAAEYARHHPRLSAGLHVDLSEWEYRNEEWVCKYEVVPPGDEAAVQREVTRQLEVFAKMVGRGPTHLDSHQHIHRDEPLRSILQREAAIRDIGLRLFTPGLTYVGSFYGQSDKGFPYPDGISAAALMDIIRNLRPGLTELGCHPGRGNDAESVYGVERALECEALCDPAVRRCLEEEAVSLVSFAGVGFA